MPRGESPKTLDLPALRLGAWALVWSALLGCGPSRQEFALMRDELGRVQREHESLTRRLGELTPTSTGATPPDRLAPLAEADGPSKRLDDAPGAPGSGSRRCAKASVNGGEGSSPQTNDPRACLKVVKLSPSTELAPPPELEPTPEPTGDSARPILVEGPSGREGASTTPSVRTTERSIQREYEAATGLLRQQKPKLALEAYTGFVVRHPEHPLVASAQLQRARCLVALDDLRAAEAQLEGVLATHPDSSRVPDVLLELGQVQQKMGAHTRAQASFERLRREFPKSEAARKTPRTERSS